jgi:hypothetical protein
MNEPYKDLVFKIISFLKLEQDHEGTNAVITPSELLDKIAAFSVGLPDVRDEILGKEPNNTTR